MDSIKLSPEIEQYIQESDKNRNYSQFTPDKRSKGEKEREFFISKFPRSEIRDIKMLDYVQGKRVNGNPDPETFSTLIEFGSKNFGTIGGGSAKKHGIYMRVEEQKLDYNPKFASADVAYDSIINLIADCVNHAENFIKTKDWKKFSDIITQIAESQTGTPSIPVISKIIAMYYPDEFLRIWSHQWLNKILDLFQVNRNDLPEGGKEGRFYEKMQRVIEAKNSHSIMKEWSNKYFSYTIGGYIVEKNSEKIESPLLKFLKSEMKMQANYQPIVIKTLLEKGSPFTVSIKEIRKKFDELNFGRMSYTKASGRPGGNDAISSVAGALKKFVKFPEGTSQGNATLNDGVVNSAEIPECLKICGQEIARWHIEKIVEGDYNLWRIPPGRVKENYPYEREFLESNTIGVGWGRIGDDVVENNMTKEQTEELFHKKYPPTPEEPNSPQAFTNFTHEMKPKDIIVLIKKKTIVDFAIVVGPNRYQKDSSIDLPDNAKSYSHRRDVVWLNRGNIPEETFEFSRMSTCDRVANTERKKEYVNILLEEESESRDYWLFKAETKVTTEWDEMLSSNKISYGEFDIDLSKFYDENGESKYKLPKGLEYSKEFRDKIDKKLLDFEKFPRNSDKRNTKISWTAIMASTFAKIKNNDIVIVWSGHKIHGYGKVVGEYEYIKGNTQDTKQVEWDDTFVEIDLDKATPENKLEVRWKAGEIQPLPDEWKKLLFGTKTSRSTMSVSAAENSDLLEYQKTLEKDLNLLFYGPPGTGKTFWAENLAELITSNQVPPETVVELKEQTWLGVAAKVLLENNGTALHYADFAKFARQIRDTTAITPEETIARDIRQDISDNGNDSIFIKSSEGTYGLNIPTTFVKAAEIILLAEHRPLHTDKITKIAISKKMIKQNEEVGITPTRSMNQVITQDIANDPDNSTFFKTGPGTYVLRKQIIEKEREENHFIRKVTFHPSYSYEEFVEGIRPNLDSDQVSYKREDGVFKEICYEAKLDPDNRYVLLIDEINRGNIPKIFGELITLIEDEKREDYKVNLTYSKGSFSVPKNLYIIGTMNTADQSISHLDTALRRRFSHVELMPDVGLIDKIIEHNGKKINLKDVLEKINTKIKNDAGRERQIGHSYFMKNDDPITEIVTLRDRFKSKIIPLIQDYFYEDMNKVHKILGDGFIDKTKETVKKETFDDLNAFADAVNAI